jgi:hypothetical protein
MDIPLPVGHLDTQPLPLGRFLPPVDEGVITQVLKRYVPEGGLIFDPFGASPRVALEAAGEGYRVLVAANNPINHFVLQKTLKPFSPTGLQSALAHIAAIPKDESRLEMILQELYRSDCNRCGQSVVVEFFVWDKELGGPTHKVYTCEQCSFSGEASATEEDWNRAADYSRKGLQHAIALEQVAPRGDPDRQHAEAALNVYPGRAIYALVTLLNKLNQLDTSQVEHDAIKALLLSCFDAGNGLWSYPEGRSRPRQLIASARFRENNLWLALEKAVGTWAMPVSEIDMLSWEPGLTIQPGQVAIAPNPAREVAHSLQEGEIAALMSIPPRPNQAFWSLSALWAAWLWGREAAASIKVALRRRRYDWAWHAGALRTVLSGITASLSEGTPGVIYIPEAEPGFLEAAFTAFDASNFSLEGRAFRAGEEQAFLYWKYPNEEHPVWDDLRARDLIQEAVSDCVIRMGEPVPYASLHASVWSSLADKRLIAAALEDERRLTLQKFDDWLAAELRDTNKWEHLTRGAELETGSYWTAQPIQTDGPLFDRVERMVLGLLRSVEAISDIELDIRVCEAFPGLITPDRRLIMSCLHSYAQRSGEGLWVLRPEDYERAREDDCREVQELLRQLGRKLGYVVPAEEPLRWMGSEGTTQFTFQVSEMASWGWERVGSDVERLTMVIPGGRSGLVAEKARRDPRVREWMQQPGKVIKFRHVRRLVTESNLNMINVVDRMAIDPPERQDPQMPLL